MAAAAAAPRRRAPRAPAAPHFEFFGPYLGPTGIMLGLPLVCYALAWACNDAGCATLAPPAAPGFAPGARLWSWEAAGVVVAWVAAIAALHLALPGARVQGAPLPDGSRLAYKLNGLRVAAAALGVIIYFSFIRRDLDLAWAHRNLLPLLSAAVALSFALSLSLYARSAAAGRLRAAAGDTRVPLYDFFIGRELNPRLGALDLKEFCELYPGLIGWLALDLAAARAQLDAAGALSPAMLLVLAFQGLYVADALWHERAILTTMDITTDGFGFMLAFGDLAWVPFVYSLQARALVGAPSALSHAAVAGIVALKLLGYCAFRGANSQKDLFRRDPAHPAVAHLRSMPTKRGTRLLTSGWWGAARHINYTGDWVMGAAWCLPCGFGSPVPYFYVAYFGALLVHRCARDEAACALKYGADWARYCKAVPARFFPHLF
jgi:delta14-sterol reductase